MTRRGSGARVRSSRVARSGAVTARRRSVLQGGDQRERRLGALVEVGPVRGQAVIAAAGRRVPHRRAGVVVAQEPRDGLPHAGVPAAVAGHRGGGGAGVGERGDLDRLLVVAGPWRRRAASPPTGTTDSRPSVIWMSRSQVSIRRPAASSGPSPSRWPAAMTHLGERGVGVGEALLRPRPLRVVAGRADSGGGVGEQRGGERRCPGRRAAPRPRRARRRPSRAGAAIAGRRRAAKAIERLVADPRRGAARRRGAQAPQRAAPPVAEAGLVGPAPVVAEPVVEGAGLVLRVGEEGQVALGEPEHRGRSGRARGW